MTVEQATTEALLPGPKVYFALFGGVRAWRNQQPLELGPPQRRALLALLLAADGQMVSVADLVDLLWGERPSASALNLVHRHIGELRRVFEPELAPRQAGQWLVRSGHGYQLRVDAVSADLRRFRLLRQRAADPRTSALTAADLGLRAMELAAGAPGDGLTFPLASAAPFQAIERERVAAAVAAADAALLAGRPQPVTPILTALCARHPLDEPLHARLIDCLAATGRRAEALQVYASIRRRLNAELGIEPGPLLGDARRRTAGTTVRSGVLRPRRWPGRAASPAQLPSAARVTGRERELAAADAALAREPIAGHRICAITGEPGTGKTDFALHWAHRVAAQFPDGQFYADLCGDDRGSAGRAPAEVLRGFLAALGAEQPSPEADPDTVTAAFREAVRGHRMLFVLDDARGSAQVRAVLPGEPQCLVIATSRHCLTGLIAHEGAHPIPLESLAEPAIVASASVASFA